MIRSRFNAVIFAALAACIVASAASTFAQRDSPERMREMAMAQAVVTTNKEKVRLNPNDAQAHKALGDAYLVLEESENAYNSYKEVLRVTPGDAEAYRGMGEAYERVFKHAKARDFYREAVRLNPQFARAQMDLGNISLKLFQYEDAIGALKEGIRLKPSGQVDYGDYYSLGEAYLNAGKYEDAVNAYQQALKLRSDYGSAYTGLAAAYNGLRQYENAIASAERALKHSRYDDRANRVLGDSYSAMDRYEKAVEYYQESIRGSSNSYQVEALLGLGLTYNSMGRYEDALASFEKGVVYATRPKQFSSEVEVAPWLVPTLYFGMAQANLNVGRGQAAADAARKYIEIASWANANAPYAALLSYFGNRKAGRPEEAVKVLDEASAHMTAKAWPYPVLQHLRGELKDADLLALATDTDKMTEARAYVGMSLALWGRLDKARSHLEWVARNGNRKFTEYTLAQAALRRITTGAETAPLAPGNPPLTREVSDVVAEFLAFMVTEATGKPLVADQQFKDSWALMLAAKYGTRSAVEQERLSHIPTHWATIRLDWPNKKEEERAQLREQWREFLKQATTASTTREQVEAEKSLQALQALIHLGQQRPLQPAELVIAANHMDNVATGLRQLGGQQNEAMAEQMAQTAQEYRAAAQQGTAISPAANPQLSQPTTQANQRLEPNGAVRMVQQMNNNHFSTMSMIQFMSRRF
ncbi:MAG: tetratricopeptide repeat protein [Pyrinomonadaceae bacterium]